MDEHWTPSLPLPRGTGAHPEHSAPKLKWEGYPRLQVLGSQFVQHSPELSCCSVACMLATLSPSRSLSSSGEEELSKVPSLEHSYKGH